MAPGGVVESIMTKIHDSKETNSHTQDGNTSHNESSTSTTEETRQMFDTIPEALQAFRMLKMIH